MPLTDRRARTARLPRLAFVAVALCLVASAQDVGSQTPPAPQPATRSRVAPSRGSRSGSSSAKVVQVYRKICIDCHDSDGKGEIGRDLYPKIPDFTVATWQDSQSDAALAGTVLAGKGKMPAMKTKLGALDVKEVIAFVRGFRDGKQVVEDANESPPTPASRADSRPRGSAVPAGPAHRNESQLFRKLCAACHGTDGHGTVARDNFRTIPDFTVDAWQAKRSDAQLVVTVLEGKGTNMPPFRGKINREQARGLINFIRSFSPSGSHPAATAPDEFETKFRELEDEIEALQRKIRALPPPRPKGA